MRRWRLGNLPYVFGRAVVVCGNSSGILLGLLVDLMEIHRWDFVFCVLAG